MLAAVTTKFTAKDELDIDEMQRCFALQMQAGCTGLIACGSLGEGPMLSHDERLAAFKGVKGVTGKKPALMTLAEAATREASALTGSATRASAMLHRQGS